MKKVLLVSLGSYGDLYPFVETAKELKKRKTDSVIVASEGFREAVEGEGVEFCGLKIDIADVLNNTMNDIMGDESKKPAKLAVYLSKLITTMFEELFEKTYLASKGVSAVVASPLSVGSTDVAERTGAKNFLLEFQPLSPTGAHQPPITGKLPLNAGFSNKLIYWAMHKAFFEITKREINKKRRSILNLSSIDDFTYVHYQKRMKTQFLFAYSREILPKPYDWDDNYHVIGFISRKDQESDLSSQLRDFIGSDKVIYIGFGSMTGMDREKFEKEIKKIADSSRRRIILHKGWSDMEIKRDNVLNVGFVDHNALFKHVDAAVTHNGCGTMASLLRNRVKSVGVPFALDQYFWADLLYRRGLAGRPVPAHSFSADKIIQQLNFIEKDKKMEERLKAIGEKVSAEDGACECARIVERAIR